MTSEPTASPGRSLVILGFATVLSQSVLIREAMASLGGSELAWGVVLFTWLAGMAAGSALGIRLGSPRLGTAMPVLCLALSAGGVILLRAAPALAGGAGGEAIGTLEAAWLWLASVLPTSAAGGLGFTLLAARTSGPEGGATAYALEAGGGFLGGLVFTFLLVPHGTVATLTVGFGAIVAGSLHRRQWWLVLLILAATAVSIGPADSRLAHWTWRWASRPGNLAAWAETRQQRLELAAGEPRALYSNGRLLASFPNPWVTAPRGHLLMLLHRNPRRVLMIGGLADGTVVTILGHPVDRLDLVEDDPELPALLLSWYGADLRRAMEDPRLHLHAEDPIRALRRGGPWDLILLLDGDPTSLRQNRTRTLEFFRACRFRLASGGLLVVQIGAPDTYLAGVAGRLVGIEAATLEGAFGNVTGLPGDRVLLVSGRDGSPPITAALLAQRWATLRLSDPAFDPRLLPVLLDPGRRRDLHRFLEHATEPPNTTARPRAVLPAVALREGRGRPAVVRAVMVLIGRTAAPLLILPALLLLSMLIRTAAGRVPRVETAAVVGASSMTWWLLLAAIWQGIMGSVYAEVGALSAAFMGGLALAAMGSRRWAHAERRLPLLLGAGALLSLLISSPLPSSLPRLAIPLLLVAGGAITGAAFPGLSQLIGGSDPRRGGGGGFAADEAGAALAALVAGLLAIPWAGLPATALTVAALDIAAAVLLSIAQRRPGRALIEDGVKKTSR